MKASDRVQTGLTQSLAAERCRPAEPLPAGLEESDEIAAAWAEEVERRIDALSRGETSIKPVEDVIAAARARIGAGAG